MGARASAASPSSTAVGPQGLQRGGWGDRLRHKRRTWALAAPHRQGCAGSTVGRSRLPPRGRRLRTPAGGRGSSALWGCAEGAGPQPSDPPWHLPVTLRRPSSVPLRAPDSSWPGPAQHRDTSHTLGLAPPISLDFGGSGHLRRTPCPLKGMRTDRTNQGPRKPTQVPAPQPGAGGEQCLLDAQSCQPPGGWLLHQAQQGGAEPGRGPPAGMGRALSSSKYLYFERMF